MGRCGSLIIHACIYVCMYVCMYVHTYVCMYIHMYVCTYICMYVYLNFVCNVSAHILVNYKALQTLMHFMPSFSNIFWVGTSFASTTTRWRSSIRTFIDSHFEENHRGWLSGIVGLGASTNCKNKINLRHMVNRTRDYIHIINYQVLLVRL